MHSFRTLADGSVRVHLIIPVSKSITKAIVVGKGGELMQHYVVARAQEELQIATGKKVHLSVSVEVAPRGLQKFQPMPSALQMDAMEPVGKKGYAAAAAVGAGAGGEAGVAQAAVQEADEEVAELLEPGHRRHAGAGQGSK